MARRFPLRFDPPWEWFFTLLLLPPSRAFVEIAGDQVEVRMAWAFRVRFPRSAVASAVPYSRFVLSIGVHGAFGRWLVNGSTRGLLSLTLEPPQRARVLGIPIRLRELLVSVQDPEGLREALTPPG